jgi:hypothetical protein
MKIFWGNIEMGKAPAFQFYPADWVQDTAYLSLEARGAWIDILCALWRSTTKGTLTLNLTSWARVIRTSNEQASSAINELIITKICDGVTFGNGDVTLSCRRMIREENERRMIRFRVDKFRKKQIINANVTPVSSSSESTSSESTSSKHKAKVQKTHLSVDEIEIPESLKDNTQEIRLWLTYKKEKGQPYRGQTGLNALWDTIEKIPKNKRKESIEHSMGSNWAGIFEKRGVNNDWDNRQNNGKVTKGNYAAHVPGTFDNIKVHRCVTDPKPIAGNNQDKQNS